MEPLLLALTQFSPVFQFHDVTNTIHFLQHLIGYIDDNSIMCNLPDTTPIRQLLQTATSILQSWQTLLRHTGGDLSLSNFLFTLVTWTPTRDGNLRMATINETPGDLLIVDTATRSVCIRRVEPSHTERILGVIMAITGQMTTEHAYRLEQSRALAARIRRAPLLCIEAEAAYRHWVHIASYCIPITTFTIKQCENS